MNRIFSCVLLLLFLLNSNNDVLGMFTKNELAAAQPLVQELMESSLNDFRSKKISGSDVADNALKLANEAESDVAKYICMKGAISYYVRDKAYDKAADTIELMMSKFKDMPPETLLEIISSATSRVTEKSAPRLFEIRKAVSIKIASTKKIRALKAQLDKTPTDKRLICRYAELMASENKWNEALKMFAKMDGDLGRISQDIIKGSVTSSQIAEFWWDYKVLEEDAKDAIRQYSIIHYQNAINKGELTGLKKKLAEKRVHQFKGMTFRLNGLIHRWSFNGNLKDSVGGRDGKAMKGNVLFRNGQLRIQPGGGYVDLGANVVPGGGEAEFTIEIWATKYSIQNWARVFQIPNNWGRNDFYWSWNHGTTKNKWQWKVPGYGAWNKVKGDGTGENEECHFVIVYGHDAEKFPYFGVYLLRKDGIYWERSERLTGKMFDTHSAFWLGHGNGDRADASYNEVRIWNRALTKDEILKSTKLGPDRLPSIVYYMDLTASDDTRKIEKNKPASDDTRKIEKNKPASDDTRKTKKSSAEFKAFEEFKKICIAHSGAAEIDYGEYHYVHMKNNIGGDNFLIISTSYNPKDNAYASLVTCPEYSYKWYEAVEKSIKKLRNWVDISAKNKIKKVNKEIPIDVNNFLFNVYTVTKGNGSSELHRKFAKEPFKWTQGSCFTVKFRGYLEALNDTFTEYQLSLRMTCGDLFDSFIFEKGGTIDNIDEEIVRFLIFVNPKNLKNVRDEMVKQEDMFN